MRHTQVSGLLLTFAFVLATGLLAVAGGPVADCGAACSAGCAKKCTGKCAADCGAKQAAHRTRDRTEAPAADRTEAHTSEARLKTALDRAIDDERHSRAMYQQVMAKHGERRPFSRIVHAEGRHEAALLGQYQRLGLTPPPDAWAERAIDIPATFRGACDASAFAEIDNVRLYDELMTTIDDETVLDVFRQLRWASAERHLPAFSRHGSGWHVVDGTPTPAQQAQVERAAAARDGLFASLVGRLGSELQSHGAASAISVCRDEAPVLAQRAAKQHGVAIGRTSWKLRNSDNTGPGWMSIVRHDRPETPQVLADQTGRLGYVTPIRVAETCLACHGPKDTLAADVRARLESDYPDDRATGFKAGDLRGWFWVEVPAP